MVCHSLMSLFPLDLSQPHYTELNHFSDISSYFFLGLEKIWIPLRVVLLLSESWVYHRITATHSFHSPFSLSQEHLVGNIVIRAGGGKQLHTELQFVREHVSRPGSSRAVYYSYREVRRGAGGCSQCMLMSSWLVLRPPEREVSCQIGRLTSCDCCSWSQSFLLLSASVGKVQRFFHILLCSCSVSSF